MLSRVSLAPWRFAMSPHALLRWCLGASLWLAMLLAQQTGWQHALGHVFVNVSAGVSGHADAHEGQADRSHDTTINVGHAPVGGDFDHENACQDCLAFHAGINALPAGIASLLPVDVATAVRSAAALVPCPAAISLAYQSRAPPVRA